MKLRRSRRKAHTNRLNHHQVYNKQYLVPGLIILTFALLYVIPFAVQRFTTNKNVGTTTSLIRKEVCRLIQMLGLVSDPLIYVFISKHYRSVIQKTFCCCISLRRQVQPPGVGSNDISLDVIVT